MSLRTGWWLIVVVACAADARADDGHAHDAPRTSTYKAPAGPSSAPAKAPPKPGTSRPVALPKAIGSDESSGNSAVSEIPPFAGVFGPAELLEQSGFESSPGDWVEYRIVSRSDLKEEVAKLRFQHVLPVVSGARWVELILGGKAAGPGEAGMRMLTRGLGRGNIERLIAKGPGVAAMELPVDMVEISTSDGASRTPPEKGELKFLGRTNAEVPYGKFEVDRWAFVVAGRAEEYWIATDKRLRFARMVRIETTDGVGLLSGAGTDAVAQLPVLRQP